MKDQVETGAEKGREAFGRILKWDLFLFLLDLEVKTRPALPEFLLHPCSQTCAKFLQ